MGRILDAELLDRLERVLRQQDEARLDPLPPGLPERQLRHGLAAVGLQPSEEIARWWRRHDGWRDESRFEVLPGLQSLSLIDALKAYDVLRGNAVKSARDAQTPEELRDPDRIFGRTWLPIFTTGAMPTVVIECEDAERSALRQVDPSEVGQPDHAQVFASSLGEFIEQAVTVLERGTYRFDAERETWMPMTWNDYWIGDRFTDR